MKNRRKIILPNKPVFKRSESNLNKTVLENPVTKKKFTSISLQQNLEFLHRQGIFFPKPLYPSGDADTYFKKTLRNYEKFDFTPLLLTTRSSRETVKVTRSLDVLKKKKSNKSLPLNQKKRPQTPVAHIRPFSKNRSSVPKLTGFTNYKKVASERKKDEETDLDTFYSPESQTEDSTSRTLKNQSLEGIFIEEPTTEEVEAEQTASVVTVIAKSDTEEKLEEEEEVVEEKSPKQEETPKMAEEGEEFGAEDFENVGEDEGEAEEVVDIAGGDAGEEEEADELKEVEKMIQEASAELADVTEEKMLAEFGEGEGEEQTAGGDVGGSFFKFDPTIDAAVLRELEEAEKQAQATAKIIYELKARVTELLKKEKHTETEARELEEKNKELKAQMILFEEKTKRIQFLIAQTNLFDKMIPLATPLQTAHREDMLPKVIVCGMTENNIPKLILCDDKKRKTCEGDQDVNIPMSVVPKFAKRLSDSYTMQEKLAAENADLEGTRYKLQSDLLNKDQTIEYLQRKLCSLQCEMRMLYKENTVLNEKVAQMSCPAKQAKHRKSPCGKGKGTCPAEIEYRLNEYSETTKLLEKQLNEMESDVKTMQNELNAVQAEREHLEQHKKVIICPPVCIPHPPCGAPPCGAPPCGVPPCGVPPCGAPPCGAPPCSPPPCMPCISPCDQALREMKEKYARLQDDFKGKVTEVAGLRADNDKLKTLAQRADDVKKQLEKKIKDLELEIKRMRGADDDESGIYGKQQIVELEQQLSVAKQRFREAQDELEELRAFIEDQQGQLDDYRNKYLEAQQEVEEQKRQIDMLEMDANRVSEQVNLEIQRIKAQFNEKLQELLPLPEVLKNTQIKLQETQQMHLLAERNNEALNRDLQIYKDKIAEFTAQMEQNKADAEMGEGEKMGLTKRIEQLENKVKALEDENDELRIQIQNGNNLLEEAQRDLDAKVHEIVQLTAQLELVREESARQVARNKERCETVRRSMQNQISDLERQLAQSRAQARAAQKDRDEIRQKMQAQINNLHENFEDAQMRIRSLQGHVNFLKESYPSPGGLELEHQVMAQDACNCAN